jgi:hypothetical protein
LSAGKIPVLPIRAPGPRLAIPELSHQGQESAVFHPPTGDISGKNPKNRPDPECKRGIVKNIPGQYGRTDQKHGDHIQDQATPNESKIQLIQAVASVHEARQPIPNFPEK